MEFCLFCQILLTWVFFHGSDIATGCYGSAEEVQPIFVFFNINKMIELETQHFIFLSVVIDWDR